MNNGKRAGCRHQRVCEVLQEQEYMQVLELCELFHVSPATIRNDLTVSEKKRLLKYIPDDAVSIGRMPQNTVSSARESLHMDPKDEMTDYAVTHLIKEGMNVALNADTTCCAIAGKLADISCRYTVITYSLPMANVLIHRKHIEVFLIAERLDKKHESFHDDVAIETIKRVNSDVFFLSPDGIDPIVGIISSATDKNIMKRMMHEYAEETMVYTGHSKFLKKVFKTICQPSDIKGILNDSELSGEIQQRCSAMGVRLCLAEK